jgi:hypothetical protein
LSYAVGIEGKEEPEALDLPLSLLHLSLTLILPCHHPQPPVDDHHLAETLTLPRLAATDSRPLTPTWMSPRPPWTPQPGQRTTDRPQARHLAASTVTDQRINSLQQKTARPIVHRRPTLPARRHLAAQSVQSVHAVPVRCDLP